MATTSAGRDSIEVIEMKIITFLVLIAIAMAVGALFPPLGGFILAFAFWYML